MLESGRLMCNTQSLALSEVNLSALDFSKHVQANHHACWSMHHLLDFFTVFALYPMNCVRFADHSSRVSFVFYWNTQAKKKNVRESKKSEAGADDIYHPNLWYFSDLLFLKDQETPWRSVSNVDSIHDDKGKVINQVSLKCDYINLLITHTHKNN
jgi:hypothetical protein